jgi:hypothetical protein
MSPGPPAGRGTQTGRRRADRASVLAGPAAPARSSRAAYRCARSRSTPAHRWEPGSSDQSPDHRRRQFGRRQCRNVQSSPVGKLDLDRRRRAQCGTITAAVINRGDHHFRETALAAAQLLPPPIICPAQTSARRAISATIAPGAKAAETIARFCSSLHHRRRTTGRGPSITMATRCPTIRCRSPTGTTCRTRFPRACRGVQATMC